MRNLVPVFFALALVLWTWASYRLQRAAQPLRLELARKGELLLGDVDLPSDLRNFVEFLLGSAFSNRLALLFGIFYVPFIAASIVVNPSAISRGLRRFHIRNAETRASFEDVMRLHDRITFLNHPILLMLVEFEILVFVASAVLLLGIFREVVSMEIGRETAMDLVEEKGIQVRSYFPKRQLAEAA